MAHCRLGNLRTSASLVSHPRQNPRSECRRFWQRPELTLGVVVRGSVEVDKKLWLDVWDALQKGVALCVLIGAHWALQLLLRASFADFPQHAKLEYLTSAMSLLAFFVIYARLLYGMVTVFWPTPFQPRRREKENP